MSPARRRPAPRASRSRGSDHHVPCPCGAELADECPRCNSTNPLGGMTIQPPIGSRTPRTWTP